MLLNVPLCDYVRLTSFETTDWLTMRNAWKERVDPQETEDFSMMQYNGKRYNHGFMGTGKQKRGNHHLLQFSGSAAALVFNWLVNYEWTDVKCTRFDAQITIPLPDKYDAPSLFDKLNGNVPYGRSVTMIRSGDGLDTVYVGRRTTQNGRFTRIYVKEYVGGRALRFETEFKGTWATDHWHYLCTGGSIASLLVTELESMGDIDFSPLATFYALLSTNTPAPIPRAVETSNPTLDWLLNTVEPVIVRMLNDHDHGTKVRRWLEDLLDWSN